MKILVRFIYGLIIALISISFASAQSLDPSFASVSTFRTGSVYNTAEQPDGKLLVAGAMIRVNGRAVTGLVRLNADGTIDQSFNARFQTPVKKVRLLPNGQILAIGDGVIRFEDHNYHTIVKLNADGMLASDFDAGTGATSSIAAVVVQTDGKILLGGSFSAFNGAKVNRLVRLNSNGSVDQQFLSTLNNNLVSGVVYTAAIQPDRKIVIGGTFDYANMPIYHSLVRLNDDGTLDTTFKPALPALSATKNADVVAISLDPQTNYWVVRTALSQKSLVRLTDTGESDPSFVGDIISPSYDYDSRLIVDASSRITLNGNFNFSNAINSRNNLARFLATGEIDNTFIPQLLDATVKDVQLLADGSLLVGGEFSHYGIIERSGLLKLTDKAQLKTDFQPVIDQAGTIGSLAQQPDGKLLLAGSFREINGMPANNIGRLNLDGTLDPAFNMAGVNGRIDKVVVQSTGQIIVAGAFTEADKQPALYVARLTADGHLDHSFQTSSSTSYASYMFVKALAVTPDGAILVSSTDVQFGNKAENFYRLLPTGAVDEQYAANTSSKVSGNILSISVLPDGRHYLGWASGFTGSPPSAVVRLNADGTRDQTFLLPAIGQTFNYASQVVVLPDNKILLGGDLPSYNSGIKAKIVRLNSDGSVDKTFDATQNGYDDGDYIENVAVQPDGRILVNHLINFPNARVNFTTLYRLLPDGKLDSMFSDFNSYASRVTEVLVQQDGRILVSGSFTEVSGQPRAGIARLMGSAVLPIAANKSFATLEVWPNPALDVVRLQLDNAASPRTVQLLDITGKLVHSNSAVSTQMEIPVWQLAAGIYMLRVNYATGPVVRRLVVK